MASLATHGLGSRLNPGGLLALGMVAGDLDDEVDVAAEGGQVETQQFLLARRG